MFKELHYQEDPVGLQEHLALMEYIYPSVGESRFFSPSRLLALDNLIRFKAWVITLDTEARSSYTTSQAVIEAYKSWLPSNSQNEAITKIAGEIAMQHMLKSHKS